MFKRGWFTLGTRGHTHTHTRTRTRTHTRNRLSDRIRYKKWNVGGASRRVDGCSCALAVGEASLTWVQARMSRAFRRSRKHLKTQATWRNQQVIGDCPVGLINCLVILRRSWGAVPQWVGRCKTKLWPVSVHFTFHCLRKFNGVLTHFLLLSSHVVATQEPWPRQHQARKSHNRTCNRNGSRTCRFVWMTGFGRETHLPNPGWEVLLIPP